MNSGNNGEEKEEEEKHVPCFIFLTILDFIVCLKTLNAYKLNGRLESELDMEKSLNF